MITEVEKDDTGLNIDKVESFGPHDFIECKKDGLKQ
jgi:hypothetical protein